MRANFVLTEVATGLRRNLTMTIAMIMTTAVSLGFFGAGLLTAHEINQMKNIYFDKLQVSVYLNDNVTSAQRSALQGQLQASPEVKTVQYVSKQQAYDRFKTLFRNQPDLVSQATPDDLPATYVVSLKNPQRYTVISQQFTGQPGVDRVQGQNNTLDTIFSIFNGVRTLAIVIALVLLLAALLLIANTIQVAAFNRRVETGIMRLVGASRWYTQLPFVLEAAVAGLAGALLAIGELFAFKIGFIDGRLGSVIRTGVIPPVDVGTILAIVPWVALIGVAMAAVTAYVTLRLYVRL